MSDSLEAERKVALANETVDLLGAQADRLRKELARLRNDLVQVQQEFSDLRGAQLLEANERLVLAALLADSLADTATSSLGELARSSQRDVLTDTPNRALMQDRLTHAMSMARRRQAHLAVLFLDIDKFKQINDTLGHAAGDAVLQLVAGRLAAIVRDSDTVSRHGGDEFLVMLGEVGQPSDAALIAAKILAAFAEPVRVGEHEVNLSLSLGIAIYPGDGDDVVTLIGRADAAMYRAKKRGGSGYCFHSEPGLDSLGSLVVSAEHAHPQASTELSHLREANQQLVLTALAAQELESLAQEAHRRHVRFLAMVAHELRSPLTPIGTAAELLGRPGTDETQLNRLQVIIKRQVAHMNRLVGDLLDGSRLSAGQFQLRRSQVEMSGVFSVAADSCRAAMDRRAQIFSMQLPSGEIHVDGDAVRLTQVFGNLLDNASKYTPRGGTISLTAECQGPYMVVTVRDNGIGISAEAMPQVFGLFVQDKFSAIPHADARGLGIGLAVVRDLVESHGGTVEGSSPGPGQGSTFVVSLPLHDVPTLH